MKVYHLVVVFSRDSPTYPVLYPLLVYMAMIHLLGQKKKHSPVLGTDYLEMEWLVLRTGLQLCRKTVINRMVFTK